MRNRALHDQLRSFAERAGERLDAMLEAGAEIPFEVAENPGARSVLYHYKPLSGQFVEQHFAQMREVEGFAGCVSALTKVEGTAAYLRSLGSAHTPAVERDRAELVLRRLLAQVFDEVAEFTLGDQRFEQAYTSFENVVYEDTVVNTVVAPLLGVRLAGERWELGGGVSLVRGDLADAPADSVWGSGRDDGEPNTLLMLSVESTPQEPPPLTTARLDFRRLLTALRLFKPGPATLGPSAWWRTDDGPWQTVPLGFAGRARGGEYWLEADDRGTFTELVELIRVRAATAETIPWALNRFEQGLEQPVATDGLSDHLLVVRALLDGGEPTAMAMAQRLAALCAESNERADLQRRIEGAFKLERLLMRGDVDGLYLDAVGSEPPTRVAQQLEDCLRALLRDIVCGHLQPDVRALADEILGVAEPAPEPAARKTRSSRFARSEAPTADIKPPEPITEALDDEQPEFEFVVRRSKQSEAEGTPSETPTAAAAVREVSGEEDVDDWGFGDDPADYSAAI